MDSSWKEVLDTSMLRLSDKILLNLEKRYGASGVRFFPDLGSVFRALKLTVFDNVKVVILGQDPYHKFGQADGLAFSVPKGVKCPPSLQNIFKEIGNNYGDYKTPKSGDLSYWAESGVLLLNSILTVEENMPLSHLDLGWQVFSDHILSKISELKDNCVFLLWGRHAKMKTRLIDCDKHLVLGSSHPSPLSSYRGFLGCNHFKLCNDFLFQNGREPIVW